MTEPDGLREFDRDTAVSPQGKGRYAADLSPGWLKVRHETRNLAGGLFEEDAEVWDAAGRLVPQSRQLALVPRPMA